jgi:hypothetical protein
MPNVIDQLFREQNRTAEIISQTVYQNTPYIDLIPRGNYPANLGNSIKYQQFENNRIQRELINFSNVAATTYGSNSSTCTFTGPELGNGLTQKTLQLVGFFMSSKWFCAKDFNTAFQFQNQWRNIVENFADNTRWVLETHGRNESHRITGEKIVLDGSITRNSDDTTSKDAFPTSGGNPIVPTSRLSQPHLNAFYQEIISRGGGQPDARWGLQNGQPQLLLITGAETSDDVLRNVPSQRTDINYGEPDALLKPLGVSCAFRGFYHMIDPYPSRYYIGEATKSITQITRSGSTATATATSHGYSTGDKVFISGATSSSSNVNGEAYNGAKTITVTDANTFTFTVQGEPDSPATGTLVARKLGSTTGSDHAYVEVSPFEVTSTTLGSKTVYSQIYQDAPFEASLIWSKKAMKFLIPPLPPQTPGGPHKLSSYVGDFKMVKDKSNDDPYGLQHRYISYFEMASQIWRNEFAYKLLHLRCPTPAAIACD